MTNKRDAENASAGMFRCANLMDKEGLPHVQLIVQLASHVKTLLDYVVDKGKDRGIFPIPAPSDGGKPIDIVAGGAAHAFYKADYVKAFELLTVISNRLLNMAGIPFDNNGKSVVVTYTPQHTKKDK